MTTALAASSTALLPSTASIGGRAVAQDGQASDGGWQNALETASQDAQPSAATSAEASYLLALGNLGATPSEVLPLPATVSPAPPGRSPEGETGAPRPAPDSMTHAKAEPHFAEAASAATPKAVARPTAARAGATDQPVSSRTPALPSIGSSVHDASDPAREPRLTEAPEADHVGVVLPASNPMAPQAAYVLTAYAAAMSQAPAPDDRGADFSIASASTPMPVRVHVQWRDRVADVWIGLHRRAFDQLPHIRAGVADWVTARGGVLGRVVCNGETLTRIAPSSHFLGAL